MKTFAALLSATVASLAGLVAPAFANEEVNVYSYRQTELIQPVIDAFEKKTGITANVLFLDKGLIERMQTEGENSPADVILTVDISRLTELKAAGVTQSLSDPAIARDIAAKFRDPDGQWFGLTAEARVVYASNKSVKQTDITYEELAEPKWKGKVCMRDGQHSYNLSLFASLIARHGESYTETWLKGLKANLVRRPNGSDRTQAQSIMEGKCDIALGDAFYIADMLAGDSQQEEKQWAKSVRILFPNARTSGTHVNISGMALAKYAPNKDNAVKFMEFLASKEGQEIYAASVNEYPVLPGAAKSPIVTRFGPMKPDDVPLADIARYRGQASELVDEVGFNDGPDE